MFMKTRKLKDLDLIRFYCFIIKYYEFLCVSDAELSALAIDTSYAFVKYENRVLLISQKSSKLDYRFVLLYLLVPCISPKPFISLFCKDLLKRNSYDLYVSYTLKCESVSCLCVKC